MVVVTISMLDIQLPSEEIHQEVRNVVLLQPEEPVLSEVVESPSKRMSEELKLAFFNLIFELERQCRAGFIQQVHVLFFVSSSSTNLNFILRIAKSKAL